MRFFRIGFLLLSFNVCAQQTNEDWLSGVLENSKNVTEQMQRSGELESFAPQKLENDVSKYLKDAQSIADHSQITEQQKRSEINAFFGTPSTIPNELSASVMQTQRSQNKRSLSAVFVSFSMSDTEMRDAFIVADQFGAEVYFNGMHQDDKNIMDTISRIKRIMMNVDAKPKARFNPKAFEELSIHQVPVLFHGETGKVGYVAGILNFDWLKRQMDGLTGVNDFGIRGPTDPVEEENIIHVFQRRLLNLDMEEKKRKSIEGFWAKQDFVSIPDAQEHSVFYINPTVRVNQDIVNPNGDVLAKAGQVINPLHTAPTKNTYYLFDGDNADHVTWALSKVDHSFTQGVQMFLTERINPQAGWEHLSQLRNQFAREIYIIPKSMVERFKITGLPAIVSTDTEKGLLRVEQVNLQKSLK